MGNLPHGMLDGASVLSLRCFVAVVETQNFSSAARQLRLAPSTVTKQVQLLEAALNVALMHRTTRRVSVTDGGARFYEHCLAILAQIESAAEVMIAEKTLSGHLRVTAPPSFSNAILGPNIHHFLCEHPGIAVDILVSSATPDLIRNRIDVAIVLDAEPTSKLSHAVLGQCRLVLCASPDYCARRGVPERMQDLVRHDCLSGRFSELAEGWTLQDGTGNRTVNVPFRLLSDSGELLRQACLGGAGIGGFYHFHVAEDLAAGRLRRVLPDLELRPKVIHAVIPHRQIARPHARAFIAFIRALIEARGPAV
ncbi:LysR family transcriptional regulator [Aquabacter spiritensis]|uniref:LysR family transcriptional regulator n=1 Tax=Aquabacter spiritensis TaxID=933073 RepID=A0A4R3LYY1_9HYPH|nr:LysR family transcriptional regulator [Aquabacter spiritensis]TCT05466.1 LysR family transcriptional regulator [Aquabacter spiritensis]